MISRRPPVFRLIRKRPWTMFFRAGLAPRSGSGCGKADVAFVDEKCFINGFGVNSGWTVCASTSWPRSRFRGSGPQAFWLFRLRCRSGNRGVSVSGVCLQGGRGSSNHHCCSRRGRQETASFRGLERSFSGRKIQPGSPGGHIRRVSRYPYNK